MFQVNQTALEQVKIWKCLWYDENHDPRGWNKNEIKTEFKAKSSIFKALLQRGHFKVFQLYLGKTEDNLFLTGKMDQDVWKTQFG